MYAYNNRHIPRQNPTFSPQMNNSVLHPWDWSGRRNSVQGWQTDFVPDFQVILVFAMYQLKLVAGLVRFVYQLPPQWKLTLQ